MWARILELLLAAWLAISPFLFTYTSHATLFWTTDYICTASITLFSLLSFYLPLRKMHLFNLLIAIYLMTLPFIFKEIPNQSPLQNYMVLGILLLMVAIMPTDAHKQPKPWRDFYHEK